MEEISFSAYVKKSLTTVGWSHWYRIVSDYPMVWSFFFCFLTMSSNYVPWSHDILSCNVLGTQIANIIFSSSLLVLQLPVCYFVYTTLSNKGVRWVLQQSNMSEKAAFYYLKAY